MNTELVTININDDLIAILGEQFNPIFSQIRIYGSLKTPVFIAKDVETVLGIGDLNIRHRPRFKEDLHYVNIIIPTKGGPQKMVALTEHGLYQAFFNSSLQLAETYCTFITIVMSQLRTQGVVTMESALTELRVENTRLAAKAKMLDEETDRQHDLIAELESKSSRKSTRIAVLENHANDNSDRAEVAETVAAKSGNVEYIALLEKAIMKRVYVHASGITDDESNDLPDNDVFCFRISVKNTLSRHHMVAELFMVNPVKQITVMGVDHECSLTDLREMIETSNFAYLKSM